MLTRLKNFNRGIFRRYSVFFRRGRDFGSTRALVRREAGSFFRRGGLRLRPRPLNQLLKEIIFVHAEPHPTGPTVFCNDDRRIEGQVAIHAELLGHFRGTDSFHHRCVGFDPEAPPPGERTWRVGLATVRPIEESYKIGVALCSAAIVTLAQYLAAPRRRRQKRVSDWVTPGLALELE
jgi:hypothetical protein